MGRFSYTARMPKEFNAPSLDVKAFAEAGAQLSGSATLGGFERLLGETEGRGEDRPLAWSARGELRNPHHVQPDVWLHLPAQVRVAPDLPALPDACGHCHRGATVVSLRRE